MSEFSRRVFITTVSAIAAASLAPAANAAASEKRLGDLEEVCSDGLTVFSNAPVVIGMNSLFKSPRGSRSTTLSEPLDQLRRVVAVYVRAYTIHASKPHNVAFPLVRVPVEASIRIAGEVINIPDCGGDNEVIGIDPHGHGPEIDFVHIDARSAVDAHFFAIIWAAPASTAVREGS